MSKPVFVLKEEVQNAISLDDALDQIKSLQEQKSELEKTIKALKAPIKAHMKSKGLDRLENCNGVTAALYETNRTNADKKTAQERLSPEDYSAIFKVATVENFKVK